MKLILATTNPHKITKLRQIFAHYFSYIAPQGKQIDIEENGKTFRENAEKKTVGVSKIYHCHAVTTDGSVLIPAPGDDWSSLLTKRFVGRSDATDFDRIEALLELMKNKKGSDRAILREEAVALANNGELLFSAQVEGDRGEVQETYSPEQYQSGIWQCTVTCCPQFGSKNSLN